MSLGTAGAVQDACRMLRDAGRAAAALGAGRVYARVFNARADPQFEAFPCGLLCMECRFLADPPVGDPMRTDAAAESHPPCPHCSSTAWTDLRNADAKEQIDIVDEFDREEKRRNIKRRIIRTVGFGGLGVLVSAIFISAGPSQWGEALFAVALLTFIFGPIVAIVAGALSSGFSVAAKPRRNPARWRMAAPRPPRRRGVKIRGPVAVEEPVVAPLTGRRCAAYEVGVREDGNAKARAETWSLLEQGFPALRVGEAELAPGQAYLQLQRTPVDPADLVLDAPALSEFLRARGLDPVGSYTFFETIVAVDEPACLFAGKGGAPPVLRPQA